jgi:hypothetical protein
MGKYFIEFAVNGTHSSQQPIGETFFQIVGTKWKFTWILLSGKKKPANQP